MMSSGLRRTKRVFGRASGWLAVAAVVAGLAVGCGPAAPAQPAAPAAGGAGEALHPLARRQAEAQAQQAPSLQQAQEAAAAAVAAREAAEAAALEQAKAEAVGLLGEAVSLRQAGQLGAAVDQARQALARWPDYADARSFLGEVEPQAAAQATAQARQAEADARARRPPGHGHRPGPPRPPAPGAAGRQPTPGPSPLPADGDVLARAHGLIAGMESESLRELAATLVQRQVQVEFGPLPPGALGVWQPQLNTITVAEQFRTASVEGVAGILVHEATHAYDHYRGRVGATTGECYDLEGRAFANQARYWEARHGRGGKPGATDPLEKQMNTIMLVVNEKPLTFAVELHGPVPGRVRRLSRPIRGRKAQQ